jgi:glycosyltransferase involved in cell wall biosynthesis
LALDLDEWSGKGVDMDPDGTRLRIGIIAAPWIAVPPPVYGGSEAVIDLLARGLVAAGHEVRLFTTGDSTCPVPRSWLYDEALGTNASSDAELPHVARAYQELADVDIVHDHTITGPTWALDLRVGTPIVTTNHGPFTPDAIKHFGEVASEAAVIAISYHQRRTAPSVPVAAVIHHGVDLAMFPFGRGDGGYLLFLGRMNPDKGVHRAIAIARAAGKKLLIAAKMWEPAERAYFAEQVEPLLGDDAVYLGEVGGERKLELLAGAEALLNPIRWPEPFGMVMIEALACGTPVLTFCEGAAPEIVEHGRSGFVCADEDDMVARIAQLGSLDRAACRDRVVRSFSAGRFVDDHVALYRRVLADRLDLVSPSLLDLVSPTIGDTLRARHHLQLG